MAKLGVADYGMYVWYGGNYDTEQRLSNLKDIGFLGTERIYAKSAEDVLTKSAWLKKEKMSFATCEANDIELSIKWTAAIGGEYVWANAGSCDLETYKRQLCEFARVCKRYGVKAALHNHLGTTAESQEAIESILKDCSDVYLLLDTGHLAVAGGDVKYVAEKYYDRICAYHLKGWQRSATPDHEAWDQRGYFCGIGQGDFFIDNESVFKLAIKNKFSGWVMVEHDTHKRDPLTDLKESYDILKKWEKEAEEELK